MNNRVHLKSLHSKRLPSFLSLLLVATSLSLPLNTYASEEHEHEHEAPNSQHEVKHNESTTINARQIELAGIKTEQAQSQTLTFTDTLFGVIEVPEDNVFKIHAPYPGIVEKIHVKTGEAVKQGQTLLTLRNTETLQRYTIKSPSNGEVTARNINKGARADVQALMEITDLSTVWVEMSAFPESIEKLAVGQHVTVKDLHDHENAQGSISYISPQMTGGHIARARTTISNPDGHWRPGMHVQAQIETEKREVALAVKKQALQNFRDFTVVFARFDNTFEVRMLELGESNGDYVEVLGGLKPGTEYVTDNSFILKADVLKNNASHDH